MPWSQTTPMDQEKGNLWLIIDDLQCYQPSHGAAASYSVSRSCLSRTEPGRLLTRVVEIEKELNAIEATQKTNHLIGFIASIFGNFSLLFANLITLMPPPTDK